MAVLALQHVPAGPGTELWQCWSPTGLDSSPSRNGLEQPPPLVAWVRATFNAAAGQFGSGDASSTERVTSCGGPSSVPAAPDDADVHVSASPEAQQRAAALVAGRQSDEDKDNRADLEQTCPSKVEGEYEYMAMVERYPDGMFYADFPDIRVNGVDATTMEDLTPVLKEILLMYFEEVALGNFLAPRSRFKKLDDFEKVKGYPMPAEDRANFNCLLPFSITLKETRAWMAQRV